jgi:hypothetical protein
MKKKKLWLVIVATAVALLVVFYFVANGKNDKVTYRLEKVDRGDDKHQCNRDGERGYDGSGWIASFGENSETLRRL